MYVCTYINGAKRRVDDKNIYMYIYTHIYIGMAKPKKFGKGDVEFITQVNKFTYAYTHIW
jgi:hypothetical protein